VGNRDKWYVLVGGCDDAGGGRRQLQKLPVAPPRSLEQVERWRKEAARAGRTFTRKQAAYERPVLAGPAAPGVRDRGLHHPRQQPGGVA
jgi:hypothetical protein